MWETEFVNKNNTASQEVKNSVALHEFMYCTKLIWLLWEIWSKLALQRQKYIQLSVGLS